MLCTTRQIQTEVHVEDTHEERGWDSHCKQPHTLHFTDEEVAFTTRSFASFWRNRVDFVIADFIWMLNRIFHLDSILADSVFVNNIL